MGLFFPDDRSDSAPGRKRGFARYREVLEESFKEFFFVGFITLGFLIPFGIGMVFAILTESILVMLAAAVVGGAISGPGVACMYDIILRRLRNDKSDWWVCYKKSMGQNWRVSILPGILQCVFLGFLIFSGALLWWAKLPITIGTVLILLFSFVLFMMVFSVWWPQIVLFDQRVDIQLKNSMFFALFHLWRVLGAAVLQVVWWLVMFLFLPWTAFLVPFLSMWYILYLAVFILYRPMDEAFHIEDQINERFPGQIEKEEDE